MKKLLVFILPFLLISCNSNADLEKENKELLELTKELTATTNTLMERAEEAAAMARKAEAEALVQRELADEHLELAMNAVAESRVAQANAEEQIARIKEQYRDCK